MTGGQLADLREHNDAVARIAGQFEAEVALKDKLLYGDRAVVSEFGERFKHCGDAASAFGVDTAALSRAAKSKKFAIGGRRWRYEKDPVPFHWAVAPDPRHRNATPIVGSDGSIFASSTQAAEHHKMNHRCFEQRIRRKRPVGGVIYSYRAA